MNSKMAVEMIGIEGVEFAEIGKKDLKRKSNFDVVVITAGQEETMQNQEKRNKLTFLSAKGNDQSGIYNKKVLGEMEATIAGFNYDEIKYMLDTKTEGTSELMAECAEDIQEMLSGKYIEVNDMANTAYQQKMKDYMRDEKEYMMKHPDTAELFWDYLNRLQPVVIANMTAEMDKQLASEGLPTSAGAAMGMTGQAMPPMGDAPAETGASNAQIQSSLQNYGK
jgi:hypothetical protein